MVVYCGTVSVPEPVKENAVYPETSVYCVQEVHVGATNPDVHWPVTVPTHTSSNAHRMHGAAARFYSTY